MQNEVLDSARKKLEDALDSIEFPVMYDNPEHRNRVTLTNSQIRMLLKATAPKKDEMTTDAT